MCIYLREHTYLLISQNATTVSTFHIHTDLSAALPFIVRIYDFNLHTKHGTFENSVDPAEPSHRDLHCLPLYFISDWHTYLKQWVCRNFSNKWVYFWDTGMKRLTLNTPELQLTTFWNICINKSIFSKQYSVVCYNLPGTFKINNELQIGCHHNSSQRLALWVKDSHVILKYFSQTTVLDSSCKLSSLETICMKC